MPKLATLRDLVSQASMELGIAQSAVSSVIGSPDQDVVQLQALLFAVADEVLIEEPYKRTLGDGVWITDSAGVPKPDFTADDDRILFDARLAMNGLKFRFLQAKGLEFGEALRDFTLRMNKLSSVINGRVLDLDDEAGREI